MRTPDGALLKRWVERRDAEAFDELVGRYADMVFATSRRILGNPADAEEVAQECFLKLAEGGATVHTSLAGWLHKVATRRAIDRGRADARRKNRERRFVAETLTRDEAPWEDVKGYIDEAIAALPDALREPVVKHFLERQTHEAIAATLGVSRAAVTQRIHKGIEQIRKNLRKRGIPVAANALAALLTANTAEAAPATLASALGRIAVAGLRMSATTSASPATALSTAKAVAVGGITIMLKKALALLGVAALGVGLFYTWNSKKQETVSSAPQARPSDSVSAARESEQGRDGQAAVRRGEEADIEPADVDVIDLAPFFKRAIDDVFRESAGALRGRDGALEPYTSADIPPDNGAHYFLLAAELARDIDIGSVNAVLDESRPERWWEDPGLLSTIEQLQEAFGAIRKGLEVGNAEMPLPQGFEQPMPHLVTFRNLAKAMAVEAEMYAATGDYPAAFDNCVSLLGFANESARGGVLMSGMVGVSMKGIATRALRDILGGAMAEDYRFLSEELALLESQAYPMQEAMYNEAEVFFTGWLETQQDLASALATVGDWSEEAIAAVNSMTDAELEAALEQVGQDYYQGVVDYLALPYHQAVELDISDIAGQSALAELLFPSVNALSRAEAQSNAYLRGTRLVVAIDWHAAERGAYPESLDALAPDYVASLPEDPFTGGSFHYAPSEAGYLLYSAGADMQYNGGANDNWREDGGDMIIHTE
ncbi:MAG TPA: sigma-70 family RNA polymerase sigma factor [Candidatus Hydrogenedentes bacterium]|nr:sigma-70 family RNA polymerase sigma factor [Candidatus Hydrogenedentota bacterium]HIJ74585.1 sigma-70 family RNA polymerase sigma factor [Candidatus Hydrogenedentota bacterium]